MDSHVYPDWYVGSGVTWSHQIQYTVALHLCVGTVVYPDYPLKVFLIVTWIKYQDHSGAGFVTWYLLPGSFWGRICDVEQVPCVPVAGFVTLNR